MLIRNRVAVVVCALALCAACDGSARTTPFAQERSDLAADPQAVYGTLPNGFRYIFYPNAEPPGRLFAYLRIATGSAYETEAQQGVAHYLEHMAFNGSENFEPGELVKYFQSIGMSFGGDINAFTSFDQTAFSLDLPNTAAETIDKAFLLLGDYGCRLSLLAEELDRERGIILAEMGDRDSVGWRIRKARYRFLYDDALLSRRMPIGLESTVSSMQKPLFDDFYHTWYRPERMTLIVVGEIAFEQLLPRIEKAFAGLKSSAPARPVPSFGEFDHDGVKAFQYADEEAKSTQVEIGVATRETRRADTVERRREEAARDLAEGILNRRLQRMAKQEGAVFVSGNAYSYTAYGWSRHAGLSLTGEPEQWRAMLTVGEQALRQALTHGFTAAEIAEAKARRIRELDEAVMKASTRNSRGLAGAMLHAIADERVFLSPEGNRELLKEYLDALDNESILAAFRSSWQADHRLLLVTGNAEATTEEITAVYGASSEVEVTAPVAVEQVAFAYGTPPETKGDIVAQEHLQDLAIDQISFANGCRLNLKKTDFKKNEIQIKLRFGSGTRAMPLDKEGLDKLADMIMIDGGLGRHSREELKSLLAGRSVHVGFGVSADHMAFSGYTIPADLELTLQLMRAYLTDAGYRPEAMRLARKQYAESHKGMERTADGVWGLKVPRLLAGGDVRVGPPTLAAFNARSAAEVKAWVERQRNSTPLEISIVGDLAVEQTVALVARYFGSLPAAKGRVPEIRPIRFPAPGNHLLSVPTKIDRSQLSLFWKTTDAFSDIHRTRRVGMLAKVFSEYLRVEVREKIGGAYSPWASSSMDGAYEEYGYLMALVKVDPEATGRIREAVLAIARKLYTEGTTEELFMRVLVPTQSGIKKHRRTNGYWMSVLSGSLFRPEQIEWARSFVADYEGMTVDEINAYARTYLDPDKVVGVMIEPERETAEDARGDTRE